MKRGPLTESPREGNRSTARMFRDLANDLTTLLRQEIALAKAEVKENVRGLVKNVGQIAVGGGVAFVGLLVLIAFIIIGLGALLGDRYWLSSLIVALVLLVGGGLGIVIGANRIAKTSMAPEETVATLRETGEWARQEVRELRSALSRNGSGTLPAPDSGDGMRVVRPEAVALESMPGGRRGASGASGIAIAEKAQGPRSRKSGSGEGSLLKRVAHEFGDDDVMGQGAQVAFYMFTSLPPALLVLFALAGMFGGERLGTYLSTQLQRVLPGSASDPNSAAGFISQFIEQVVQENAPGPLSVGIITGIWAASAVFVALTNALNRAYDVTDQRSWIKTRGVALLVMVAFLALFLVGSTVLIAGPAIAAALDLAGTAELAWTILQYPLAFLLVVAAFFIVYYVLPNRDQSKCKEVLFKASAIAAALFLVASLGFRFYISNFGSYSETYGFVGAILVLLLWMYVTGTVIVLGGEIASEMEEGPA